MQRKSQEVELPELEEVYPEIIGVRIVNGNATFLIDRLNKNLEKIHEKYKDCFYEELFDRLRKEIDFVSYKDGSLLVHLFDVNFDAFTNSFLFDYDIFPACRNNEENS